MPMMIALSFHKVCKIIVPHLLKHKLTLSCSKYRCKLTDRRSGGKANVTTDLQQLQSFSGIILVQHGSTFWLLISKGFCLRSPDNREDLTSILKIHFQSYSRFSYGVGRNFCGGTHRVVLCSKRRFNSCQLRWSSLRFCWRWLWFDAW